MSGTFPRLSGPPERSTPGDLLPRRSHSPWPAWSRNAREGEEGGWAQRLMAQEILFCLGLGHPTSGPLCLETSRFGSSDLFSLSW